MGEKKRVLKSKTSIAAAAIPLATALIPGLDGVVSAHPQEASVVVGAIMLGLRALTGGGLKLW